MTDRDLLTKIQQRPFVPFRLVTTDGTGYEVRHPEMLMPGRRVAIIGLPDDPNYPSFDLTVTVSMLPYSAAGAATVTKRGRKRVLTTR